MGKNKEIAPSLDKMMKRLSKTAGQPQATPSGTIENTIQNIIEDTSRVLSQNTTETSIQGAAGKKPDKDPRNQPGAPRTGPELPDDALLKKVHAIIESEIRSNHGNGPVEAQGLERLETDHRKTTHRSSRGNRGPRRA